MARLAGALLLLPNKTAVLECQCQYKRRRTDFYNKWSQFLQAELGMFKNLFSFFFHVICLELYYEFYSSTYSWAVIKKNHLKNLEKF